MVKLFGAREALASGLADLWLASASYAGAAERVRTIPDRQRLLESERTSARVHAYDDSQIKRQGV
jgi:hypothetical protein